MAAALMSLPSHQRTHAAPWLITALAVALALASLPLLAIDWPTFKPGRTEPMWVTALVDVVGNVYAVLVVAVLAGFILSRRPTNALGWALAAIGLSVAVTLFSQEY